ncbi:MAG: S41 family peptidase [Saprospiraceae bacterium]|nr:S41 family peptidase [Saprospiraceae bacterium]
MRPTIAVLFVILFTTLTAAQPTTYPREAVLEDIAILRETLLCNHANLFVYSNKPAFDSTFEHIIGQVQAQNDALAAFNLIASVSAVVKDGHTAFYPNAKLVEQNDLTGKFFPYRLFWDGKALYVHENYGSDKRIPEGSQLLSINGSSADSVIGFMLQRLMHDGERHQFSTWVVNTFFYEFYSYYFGNPEVFSLYYSDPTGTKNNLVVQGIPKDTLLTNRRQKGLKNKADKAIFVEFREADQTAVLTIRDWHKDVLKKTYHQNFKKEINKAFDEIKRRNTQHLIIDLRDNQGGHFSYSKQVLSRLLNEPFQMLSGYQKVNKDHCSDVNNRLVKTRGPMPGRKKPGKNLFQGDVIVLTNGGSFSNTGIFCSVLKTHQRATFIGEETGGSAYVICADLKYINLPNTGIRVEIPTLQLLLKSYNTGTLSGVKPDLEISPNIGDLVAGRDKAMEAALEKIRNNSKLPK